jgi:Protein of unknown function (DUF3891)
MGRDARARCARAAAAGRLPLSRGPSGSPTWTAAPGPLRAVPAGRSWEPDPVILLTVLLRREPDRLLAIGQPAHARISGQLAAAWGNERFVAPAPREEVVLAASQHDIGMAAWDAEPDFNPDTGLPYSFVEMPLATHCALWTRAPSLALSQSRYVALLVSMHGTALYEMRDVGALSAADADRVRSYLEGQRAFQAQLRASLGAPDDEVARNQRLLWAWDHLSLAVLLGWAPTTARPVPTVDGRADLTLGPGLVLDPWPFAADAVDLSCDARVLDGPYADEAAMRQGLRDASWVRLDFRLLHSTAQ